MAIHTAEGATTADSLRRYLDQPGVEASYHVLVDDSSVIAYLPENLACWAMLSGNNRSLQLCFTGFAAWTRDEWLSHESMLKQGAAVVTKWCTTYGIPANKLTPSQVGADQSGIMGHWDWTIGKHEGTHTDPGPNFPWDYFTSLVRNADLTPDEHRLLQDVHDELYRRLPTRAQGYGADPKYADTILGYAANSDSYGWMISHMVADLTSQIAQLTKAVQALAPSPPTKPPTS